MPKCGLGVAFSRIITIIQLAKERAHALAMKHLERIRFRRRTVERVNKERKCQLPLRNLHKGALWLSQGDETLRTHTGIGRALFLQLEEAICASWQKPFCIRTLAVWRARLSKAGRKRTLDCRESLAMTLHFMKTGQALNAVGQDWGLRRPEEYIRHTLQWIILCLHDHVSWPEASEVWKDGVEAFKRWPAVFGALDSTYTPISRRLGTWCGHRNRFVVKTQAVISPSGRVLALRSPMLGRKSDSQLVKESPLRAKLVAAAAKGRAVFADTAYQKLMGILSPPAVRSSSMKRLFVRYRSRIEHFFGHIKKMFPVLGDETWPAPRGLDLLAECWLAAGIIWTMRVEMGDVTPYRRA
jgi:hypothetical protein